MKRDKTRLKEALREAGASEWHWRAASILYSVNGIGNAIEYVRGLQKRKEEETMKWFRDGDQICITLDDFVDLQNSPAVFVPAGSEEGRIIQERGVRYLPLGTLVSIRNQLRANGEQGGKMIFTPNGVVTRETCPQCHARNVRVEHGRDDEDRPCHLWHCPDCGESLVRVMYRCEHCLVEAKPTPAVGVVKGLRFEEEPATPGLITVILPEGDSCQLLWQGGGKLVGLVIDKTLFEDWFRLHRQWRRDNHHHLLGKVCRECDVPVDDRSDYCKDHNPRKRGKKVKDG